MGREIRKVPKGWVHPIKENSDGRFQPLYDRSFTQEAREWLDEAIAWDKGSDENKKEYPFYWQYSGNPPSAEYYRPEWTEPADCFQIYETVSEGTPVSPVFETKAAMVEWMIKPIDRSSPYNRGEDWQCMQGMTLEQAQKFAGDEWAPSLIRSNGFFGAGHRAPIEPPKSNTP